MPISQAFQTPRVTEADVIDGPLSWRIATVRGEMSELGLASRQLDRYGLDGAVVNSCSP